MESDSDTNPNCPVQVVKEIPPSYSTMQWALKWGGVEFFLAWSGWERGNGVFSYDIMGQGTAFPIMTKMRNAGGNKLHKSHEKGKVCNGIIVSNNSSLECTTYFSETISSQSRWWRTVCRHLLLHIESVVTCKYILIFCMSQIQDSYGRDATEFTYYAPMSK